MEFDDEDFEILGQYLQQTLSPDPNVRHSEERFLESICTNRNYAIFLLKFLSKWNIDWMERLHGAILFKNCIEQNWNVQKQIGASQSMQLVPFVQAQTCHKIENYDQMYTESYMHKFVLIIWTLIAESIIQMNFDMFKSKAQNFVQSCSGPNVLNDCFMNVLVPLMEFRNTDFTDGLVGAYDCFRALLKTLPNIYGAELFEMFGKYLQTLMNQFRMDKNKNRAGRSTTILLLSSLFKNNDTRISNCREKTRKTRAQILNMLKTTSEDETSKSSFRTVNADDAVDNVGTVDAVDEGDPFLTTKNGNSTRFDKRVETLMNVIESTTEIDFDTLKTEMPLEDIFHPRIKTGLNKAGITHLTATQKLMLSEHMNRNSIIMDRPNSGQTVALILMMMSKIMPDGSNTTQAIIITANRYGAAEIKRQLKDICDHIGITVGDVGSTIAVGTPLDIFNQLQLQSDDFVRNHIKICCFDQANRSMCTQKVNDLFFFKTQIVATTFIWAYKLDVNQMSLNAMVSMKKDVMPLHIRHIIFHTATVEQKIKIVLAVARRHGCVVFAKTRETVHQLVQRLEPCGVFFASMCGDLQNDQAIASINNYNNGDISTIIGTDVMAEGAIRTRSKCVILFDPPKGCAEYLLKASRTNTICITFFKSDANIMENIAKIHKIKLEKF